MLDFFGQEIAGEAATLRVSTAVGCRPLYLAWCLMYQGLVTQCIGTNPFPEKKAVSSLQEMNQTS